jgi:diguanylate cyclase (GGDEF)-like protein
VQAGGWSVGNPLSWSLAKRCSALALVLTIATSLIFATRIADGWPLLPRTATESEVLVAVELVIIAGWVAIALVGWRWSSSHSVGTALAIATSALFTISSALFTLMVGPFAAPGWIAYLGGCIVGYVLLGRRHALASFLGFAACIVVGSVLIAEGTFAGTPIENLVFHLRLDIDGVIRGSVACLGLFGITFLVIAFVVERWRLREAGYEQLASTDLLTGLANRRRFLELATHECARSRRHAVPLAIVIVDLDHFKTINDQHGHAVGDKALSLAAAVLRSSLRELDVIARYGGEEFAVLLPMTDATGAAEVAERCRRRLASSPLVLDQSLALRVTASMGVAADPAGDVETLIRRADAALYRAKAAGRDRIELA